MNYYGIKLNGKLKACNGCMQAKARAKNIKQQTETTAQPGQYLFLMLPICSLQSMVDPSTMQKSSFTSLARHGWAYQGQDPNC